VECSGCLRLLQEILTTRDDAPTIAVWSFASKANFLNETLSVKLTDGNGDGALFGDKALSTNAFGYFIHRHAGRIVNFGSKKLDGRHFFRDGSGIFLTVNDCRAGDVHLDHTGELGNGGQHRLDECPHWERVADVLGGGRFEGLVISLELIGLDLGDVEKVFFGFGNQRLHIFEI